MTATFHVGDAIEVMSKLPEKSVDLVISSPPFLALRSYLPSDHPDKALEGGSQATPGEYIDWLLDVVEACARVLAPHGSLCFELGDTYSGSGGAGEASVEVVGEGVGQRSYQGGGPSKLAKPGTNQRMQSGDRWPLAKSLSLIPESFRFAMVYGINPHTGRRTEPWRLRNVIRWVRPNPPVGALGDKFRPATSELMVFCKAKDRYFDLDAVREPGASFDRPQGQGTNGGLKMDPERDQVASAWHGKKADLPLIHNPSGAPPLDWWNIPPGGYSGFTTRTVQVPVDLATFDGFSGDIQCITSADCPEHGDQSDPAPTGSHDERGANLPIRNLDIRDRLARARASGSVPTDPPLLPTPEAGNSDLPDPGSTPAATPRSKASRKKAPAPATNSPDTASDRTAGHIADTSTEPLSGAPHPDTPESRTSTPDQPSADPGTPLHTTDKPDQQSACTCSYFVEKSDNTSHYAVWPPELLIKPVKAMCPESVCRTCGEPRRRIVSQLSQERSRLSAEIVRGRQAMGLSQKDVAAWFPSVTGGLTGCVWNWENEKNVPTVEQWPILKERLGLSGDFDELIEAESRWNDAEYVHVSNHPSGNTQNAKGEVYQRLPARKDRIPPDRFSDCGHDNWRPGVVLDPFAGSGTTLAVATGHGRDAIGIDLDERNYDLALDRVGPLILERGLIPEA